MGETTGISWCDSTFNAWIGCERVSPGCDNCYAERGSRRLAAQHGLKLWAGDCYFTADSYWQKPLAWNRAAQASGIRRRVFGGSYMDPFEGRDDQRAPLARLYSLVCDTPWLDWLLLTKRPEHAEQACGAARSSTPSGRWRRARRCPRWPRRRGGSRTSGWASRPRTRRAPTRAFPRCCASRLLSASSRTSPRLSASTSAGCSPLTTTGPRWSTG